MKKFLTKVGYMAFGSLLTLIGYHFGDIDNNTVNAQQPSERVANIVDKIRVRQIEIVGSDNNPRIYLGTDLDKGQIKFVDNDDTPYISLKTTSQGGQINVNDNAGKTKFELHVKDHGGNLRLFNSHERSAVALSAEKHGGMVVTGPGQKGPEVSALLAVVNGDPIVQAIDMESNSMATLHVTKDRGRIELKSNNENCFVAGMTADGKGFAATYNKNGTLTGSIGVAETSTHQYRRRIRESIPITPK